MHDQPRYSTAHGRKPRSAIPMRTLIFWQNIPSLHQAPLIRAVADRWDGNVLVVTEDDVRDARRREGWHGPDFGEAQLLVQPGRAERRAQLRAAGNRGIHIFTGFHAYPETSWTLRLALRSSATVGIFAEAGRHNDGKVRPPLRYLRYHRHALRLGKRLDLLLTPGEIGSRWYRRCGFPMSKIANFPYYVEADDVPSSDPLPETRDTVELLFVGRLIHRKAVDVLLDALAGLSDEKPWRLTIIGSGPCQQELRSRASRSRIGDRIEWRGNEPNTEVRRIMSEVDCLILPSRFDGWGAVVNEALSCGTRVITSNACGAADFVRHGRAGRIVRTDDAISLREAIAKEIDRGGTSTTERARIRRWTEQAASPEAGADYLIEILRSCHNGHPLPQPPWRRTRASSGATA